MTVPLSAETLDELERLAKAAVDSPSCPWEVEPCETDRPPGVRWCVVQFTDAEPWPVCEIDPGGYLASESGEANARYIASVPPWVTLALVEAARTRIAASDPTVPRCVCGKIPASDAEWKAHEHEDRGCVAAGCSFFGERCWSEGTCGTAFVADVEASDGLARDLMRERDEARKERDRATALARQALELALSERDSLRAEVETLRERLSVALVAAAKAGQ